MLGLRELTANAVCPGVVDTPLVHGEGGLSWTASRHSPGTAATSCWTSTSSRCRGSTGCWTHRRSRTWCSTSRRTRRAGSPDRRSTSTQDRCSTNDYANQQHRRRPRALVGRRDEPLVRRSSGTSTRRTVRTSTATTSPPTTGASIGDARRVQGRSYLRRGGDPALRRRAALARRRRRRLRFRGARASAPSTRRSTPLSSRPPRRTVRGRSPPRHPRPRRPRTGQRSGPHARRLADRARAGLRPRRPSGHAGAMDAGSSRERPQLSVVLEHTRMAARESTTRPTRRGNGL